MLILISYTAEMARTLMYTTCMHKSWTASLENDARSLVSGSDWGEKQTDFLFYQIATLLQVL